MDWLSTLLTPLFERFGPPRSERQDRRRLAHGSVRCGLRAESGRVFNIGTEWSVGVADLSPGHLRFVPSMGIVGDRDIDVVSSTRFIGATDAPTLESGTPEIIVLTTAGGTLLWAIPAHIADELRERIAQ